MSDNANPQQNQEQPLFEILRIYSKDCSLETPNVPQIFGKQGNPELAVEHEIKTLKVADDQYEVSLRFTATCKIADEIAFICEVNQAGLFRIKNVDAATLDFLLGAIAPNTLFPYASEHISSMVNRTVFPPLHLQPHDFVAMYRMRQMQMAKKAEEEKAKNSDVANGAAGEEAPQA